MNVRVVPMVLVVAVLGAGAFAIFHNDSPDSSKASGLVPEPQSEKVGGGDNGGMPVAPPLHAADMPGDPSSQQLPPNHPPLGAGAPGSMGMPAASAGDAAITWKAPAAWQVAANPSSMRLATYRVPHAGSDTDDAEVSVVRAGGSTDANIARWIGQFDNAGKDTRVVKTVRGLKVTTVDVSGTFQGGGSMMGGGMGGGAPASHPGWTLVAAIVETKDLPYFFKMTGPTATVKASRAAFDAMIDGVTPVP